MSNYALLQGETVIATRNTPADGYFEAPEDVACGDKFFEGAWSAGEPKRTAAISAEATARVDGALGGKSEREIMLQLMRGSRRIRKESKGQASAQEVAELDALDSLAAYIEAVRAEEARLIADTALTVADANWPTP